MKRSAFASLCGVSKQQVSKYEAAGFVVVVDGAVDVAASLANLEGRLDEEKRQRALKVSAPAAPLFASSTSAAQPRATSAKVERDEIERDMKRLEYGIKAGELVHVADVAEQASQAVAALREAFANAKRDMAAELCARFDIPADQVTAIARFLGDKFEEPLGRFARVAGALAKAQPADSEPDHHTDGDPAASQASAAA